MKRHALLLLLLALPAAAQNRTLSWDEIAVTARLDERGTLHVRERQTIVFDGDWNGAERSFVHRLNQDVEMERIARIDSDGREIPLVEGDDDAVDHWDWSGGKVRWRSRLPSDPPFQQTRITYVLDYAWTGILIQDGGLYRFNHDFGLPDVEWPIRRFVLDLDLDPAWQPLAAVPSHMEQRNLPPGSSVLVTSNLRHTGLVAPKPAVSVVPLLWRRAAFAAALLAIAYFFFVFRQAEVRRGRFEPLTGPREWDDAWLRQNVLDMKPEEVGALWDQAIGPPEVAAVLARMVAEGKLESSVTPGFSLLGFSFSPGDLHLRLKVSRNQLAGYERKLVDKLFFDGDETDTKSIRKRYRSTGFNPAKEISKELEERLGERLGTYPPPSRRRTLYLLLAAGALFLLEAVQRPLATAILVAILGFGLLWLWIPAGLLAHSWRQRTERLDLASLAFLVPGLLVCLWCAFFVFNREWFGWHSTTTVPGLAGVLAFALVPVAVWSSMLNTARSRESDETIRRRRVLGTGRRLLHQELKSPNPRLHDEWLPYLLAFGLGGEVDRWFRAFGGASSQSGSFGTSSSSFGGGGGSGWSGGGGHFGGAGAMASWSVAATGLASGVSSPSSGGSSGGGGGSSGGGGGGGW